MTDSRLDLPKRLNVGCGHHHCEGWLNTDVVRNDETRPDVIVTYDDPFYSAGAPYDRVFLSHILEHIPWVGVSSFLQKMRGVLSDGAQVGVIGPDFERCVDAYRDGHVHRELMLSVAEHSDHASFEEDTWPGARHWWNCSETRVKRLLEANDYTVEIVTPSHLSDYGYPTIGATDHWQFAMLAWA